MLSRRQFLLASGACVLSSAGRSWERADVVEELRRQVAKGYFEDAIAGSCEGVAGAVGRAHEKSLFEIASCSKTFTYLLAALLWDEGKLDLDAPFVTYLPDHILAKEGTSITVRDLAEHASGFTNGWMGKVGIYSSRWPYATDAEYERAVLSVRPVWKRREKYVYSCHNSILTGFILERLTGCDLDTLARRYIWGPLGMTSTTWFNCPGEKDVIQIYSAGPQPVGFKGDQNARHVSRPIGNAGVFTCFADLQRYLADLRDRRTFSKDVYNLLFARGFSEGRWVRSFGWDMSKGTCPPGWREGTINHSGYTGQYLAVDPREGRTAIVLTNLRLTKGRAAAYEARRALAAKVGE